VLPKRPRILVVVNVFRPDLGGGVLFADLCDGLAASGFDVTVRCAYPYYPQWRDISGQNGLTIRTEKHGELTVERFGLYIPSNPNSFLQRLIYEASFYLSLSRRPIRKGQFDAALVFCPLVGSVAWATAAARRAGIPLWLNVQDFSAQAAAAGGFASTTGWLERIQNHFFRKAPFWSSISEDMVSVLKSIPDSPDEIHLIPNWLHTSLGTLIDQSVAQRPNRPHQPVRLLYSGNIGGKQNLLAFCQKLAQLETPFHFRIHGEGGRADEVRTWIAQSRDERFEMRDLTDESGLVDALTSSDLYVITERPGSGSSFVPSKLIPGMTSRTPILAICDPDGPLGREVTDYGIGTRLDWNDLERLNGIFASIAQDPQIWRSWSENARRRSNFYSRERGIARCVQALERILSLNQVDPDTLTKE